MRKSRAVLGSIIVTALLLTVANLVYPSATRILLNILWFVSLSVAFMFLAMGIMAIFGMKKEVGRMLEILMEGSFSVLDVIDFIKQTIRLFVEKIKEILLSVAPMFSYIIAIAMYLGALYLYKMVGRTYDVTILTVVVTVTGISLLSLLNLPGRGDLTKTGWKYDFAKKINRSFVDSFEVVLFVFFLTMDSTHLFYVPADLNIPLHANFFGYDLMLRGFNLNDGRITLIVVAISIVVEVIRNVLKIVYSARNYYSALLETEPENNTTEHQRFQNIKKATRKAFAESRDDLIRFIAFTTILLFVFVIFPRLKLLSMMTANITLLMFDLTFTARLLTHKQGTDLISRLLDKLLKL